MTVPTSPGPRATVLQHGALRGFMAFQWLLRQAPMRFWSLLGRGVGVLVWLCSSSRRRIVRRNLRIILGGHLRPRDLAPLVRENMVRTCMNFLSAAKIAVMSDAEITEAVRLIHPDDFENSGIDGKTAIACIPHAGNWEILARIRPFFPRVRRYGSMYRRMSNPLLEKLIYCSRTAYGCEMFSKEDGLRSPLKLAKEGGLIGVLCDQFTQEGAFLPYFGKVTGTTYLPALLYKRCRRGTLYTIYTRNTSLGHWDAVMNHTIDVSNGAEQNVYELTHAINEALAACQRESILDGFWMHDRWKSTNDFAPPQPPEVIAIQKKCSLQPFRAIVATPRAFEEALLTVPMMRGLKASRLDMQITVACPAEQAKFWNKQAEVSYVVTVDDEQTPLAAQLDSDTLYNDGPFDYAFLLDGRKDTWKTVRKLSPIHISLFSDHPCAGKRRQSVTRPVSHAGGPRHRVETYLEVLRMHNVPCNDPAFFAPLTSSAPETREPQLYIAPFSTLGSASEWYDDGWRNLLPLLPKRPTLLALEKDEARAAALAAALGLCCRTASAADMDTCIAAGDTLIAADGLLPGLAAHLGARCIVLMGARLPASYRPLGTRHATVNNHCSCHPCYREHCDQAAPCLKSVRPEQIAALL